MALVHILVSLAIKVGVLERPKSCEDCGKSRFVVAHHDDYKNPLEVRWLCRPCHGNWHSQNGPGLHRDFAGFDIAGDRIPSRIKAVLGEMRDLRESGWTLQSIGEKYGITREYVRQTVGDIKIVNPSKTSLIEEKMQEIISLRDEGKSLSQISKMLGLSRGMMGTLDIPPRRKIIQHGSITGYDYHGCRCNLCREANSRQTKKRQHSRREKGLCVNCQVPCQAWYCAECTDHRSSMRTEALAI